MLRDDAAAIARMGGALAPELRASLRASFLRECDFLRRARHPNVLQFIGVVVDGECQPQYLATELGPGELFAYHKSRFCVITYGSWQHNAISMQGLLSSKLAKNGSKLERKLSIRRALYSHLERENETPFTRENETTYLK